MGLEPTTTGITIRGSTNWATATIKLLARPTGIEPVTARLEGGCSIRLSYGRSTYPVVHNFSENFGRGGGIRTHDPLLPKQMR